MKDNIFAMATRKQLRFDSVAGQLTVEQLWQLPLLGRGANLNDVAKNVNSALRAETEESFVETKRNTKAGDLSLALEVVKFVIQIKQDETEKAKNLAVNREARAKLMAALTRKQDESIDGLTEADILAKLAAMDEAELVQD